MTNWIFLALLVPFIYSLNIFIDKYLIAARLSDYRGLPIFSSILAFLLAVGLYFFGTTFLDFKDSLLIITTGVLAIWAFSLYLEALIKEETSLLIILIQLVPIIVLTLSYFILGETISSRQFLGFGLLFITSVLVSLKKEKLAFKFSKFLVFILLSDVLWAIPYILIEYVSVNSIEFRSLIMYESVGVILGGLVLLFIPLVRQAFLKTVRHINPGDFGLIIINEGLFLAGKILTYMAVVLGPVALVSVLGSTQVFYGIVLGFILSSVFPKVFKEELSKEALIKKGVLGLMAFIGVILIS